MKKTITHTYLFLHIFLLSFSYGKELIWSVNEQEKFIIGCLKSNNNHFSEKLAKEICHCSLNATMKIYPEMSEPKKTVLQGKENLKAKIKPCIEKLLK